MGKVSFFTKIADFSPNFLTIKNKIKKNKDLQLKLFTKYKSEAKIPPKKNSIIKMLKSLINVA